MSLPAVAFALFLLAALPVRLVYQKYFDPMVLVTLALLFRPPDLRRRIDYAGMAVLGVAFVAYALARGEFQLIDTRSTTKISVSFGAIGPWPADP